MQTNPTLQDEVMENTPSEGAPSEDAPSEHLRKALELMAEFSANPVRRHSVLKSPTGSYTLVKPLR